MGLLKKKNNINNKLHLECERLRHSTSSHFSSLPLITLMPSHLLFLALAFSVIINAFATQHPLLLFLIQYMSRNKNRLISPPPVHVSKIRTRTGGAVIPMSFSQLYCNCLCTVRILWFRYPGPSVFRQDKTVGSHESCNLKTKQKSDCKYASIALLRFVSTHTIIDHY